MAAPVWSYIYIYMRIIHNTHSMYFVQLAGDSGGMGSFPYQCSQHTVN